MATIARPLTPDERAEVLRVAELLVYGFWLHRKERPTAPLSIIAFRLFEDMCSDWVCDRCGHSCTDHSTDADPQWQDRRCLKVGCACAEFVELEHIVER